MPSTPLPAFLPLSSRMIFLQIYTAQLAGLLAAKSILGTVDGLDALKSGQYYFVYPADIAASVAAAGLQGDPIDDW